MKKIVLSLALCSTLFSCAELQQIANSLPQQGQQGIGLGQANIGNALKQALNQGISKQVSKLTKSNGFYNDQLVRILLPNELQKVEQGLRSIGLGSLADEGIIALNRAAESAVKEATPVFVNAIKQMSFVDAKNILMGGEKAATNYLISKTQTALYSKFHPVVKNSFAKVGADKIWSNIISKYNSLPLVNNVNPDLTDYVTEQALKGVYDKIAIEEKSIRNNVNSRTTSLLKSVFALQD